MPAVDEWFWEGNVVAALVEYLRGDGWTISAVADTASKAQGTDIIAERTNVTLLVEVKGWPSKEFRDPNRSHEVKRTPATNQAQQWFSHALLKAMRLQEKHPDMRIALGFPDFPRYRNLIHETRTSLARLNLAIYLVTEHGQVSEL